MQSRGNAGIPLTSNVPYGYKKDPENKNEWLVDGPAAEGLQRIFRMSVSAWGLPKSPRNCAPKRVNPQQVS